MQDDYPIPEIMRPTCIKCGNGQKLYMVDKYWRCPVHDKAWWPMQNPLDKPKGRE